MHHFRQQLAALLVAAALLPTAFAHAQKANRYRVDLTQVQNDRLTVELSTPAIRQDSILFHLPKMVPGTYAIQNYGAYVQQLQAFDKQGQPLPVERRDKNSWQIQQARRLHTLRYQVDDSWQTPEVKEDIFEPAGTNIAPDSLFVLNTFGFFGYFEGMTERPFEVSIRKPAGMYGATALPRRRSKAPDTDVFATSNYHLLADGPIMYAAPDTAWLQLANTQVLVAVYSPNKKLNAAAVAAELQPILNAQKAYLGGKLPVKEYAFLVTLSDNRQMTRYGALEHSYSSFYYLPESMPAKELVTSIRDVASHEFFHIITPLNIHSEEIGSFDYMQPKMSAHLWMYEGLTEYAAHHAQVCAGLISEKTYLDRMVQKALAAKRQFNDTLAFTELSLGALDKHKEQYGNVYQKGALIGMCLDIQLRHLSNGRYGTQQLMKDLSKKYGKHRSFQDEALFGVIGQLTYPEVEQFLRSYVAGSRALPLDSIVQLAGLRYRPADTVQQAEVAFTVGFSRVGSSDTLQISTMANATKLAKRIGLQKGDQLLQFNGAAFSTKTFGSLFQEYAASAKTGDKVSWTVRRKNKDTGEWQVQTLETTIVEEATVAPTLKPMPNATAAQQAVYRQWLQR